MCLLEFRDDTGRRHLKTVKRQTLDVSTSLLRKENSAGSGGQRLHHPGRGRAIAPAEDQVTHTLSCAPRFLGVQVKPFKASISKLPPRNEDMLVCDH